jgi:predicted amidohydrolase YtcJ
MPEGHPDYNPRVFLEEERLELDVALRAYTLGGIEANGRHEELGRIAPGQLADLVVADRDPFAAPVAELHLTRAALVYVDGALVHAADAVPA